MHRIKLKSGRRVGLTLLELVVVLVILAALAALVLPRLNGVTSQANSATNADVVGDVNRAIGLFETRNGVHPRGWDSLIASGGSSFFSKLNPAVTTTANAWSQQILQVSTLDANQCASLRAAGITGVHDADESRVCPPSDNSTVFRSISASGNVSAATLVKTPIASGHGSTFIDKAFSIDQYKSNWNNEFVVFGLGGPTSIKGATMQDIPLIQSAQPAKYYARVLCVYMVPATGTTTTFPAQYVGCFLPDGTSLRDNLDNYNNANVNAN